MSSSNKRQLSSFEVGATAKQFTLVVTRVYPEIFEVMLRKEGATETKFLNANCHDAILAEDERLVNYNRAQIMSDCRSGQERKIIPSRRYSINHLNHTYDFSSDSIQGEIIAALLNENQGAVEDIVANIPSQHLNVIQDSVLRIRNTVEAAAKLETENRLWNLRKINSSRPMAVVKGFQMMDNVIIEDEEIEVFIYGTVKFEEHQFYQFCEFTVCKKTCRTRLVSNTSFKVELISNVQADTAKFKRISRGCASLAQLLPSSMPLHGEIDVIGKINEILPPTPNGSPEYVLHFETESCPATKPYEYLQLCCGNFEDNNFDKILQPGNKVRVKNVRWERTRSLLIADHLSEFKLVELKQGAREVCGN